jgi:hypothetical protein
MYFKKGEGHDNDTNFVLEEKILKKIVEYCGGDIIDRPSSEMSFYIIMNSVKQWE